jgi:hypothetical protein
VPPFVGALYFYSVGWCGHLIDCVAPSPLFRYGTNKSKVDVRKSMISIHRKGIA